MDTLGHPMIDTKALFAPRKGKEATKGQKQIFEDNVATIKFYSIMAVVPLLLKLLLSSPFSTTTSTLLTIWAVLVQSVAIVFMYHMAKPILSGPSHVVVDGGIDLNLKSGFADNLKDVVITTCICTGLSMYSNGFWLLWLWLPAYLVYYIWMSLLGPWIFQRPEEEPADVADKKRKKLERKMARAGYR